MKYEISVISKDCKFYRLTENGKIIASIEYSRWRCYKYNVEFIYGNPNKAEPFKTLAEAKKYIAKTLAM